jgi:hypothetical protein
LGFFSYFCSFSKIPFKVLRTGSILGEISDMFLSFGLWKEWVIYKKIWVIILECSRFSFILWIRQRTIRNKSTLVERLYSLKPLTVSRISNHFTSL